MVNEHDGSVIPANAYDKAVYKLHPSFGDREKQSTSSLFLTLVKPCE